MSDKNAHRVGGQIYVRGNSQLQLQHHKRELLTPMRSGLFQRFGDVACAFTAHRFRDRDFPALCRDSSIPTNLSVPVASL
jgi:hypothetical protein